MKDPLTLIDVDLVRRGIALTEIQQTRLTQYATLAHQWNRQINLTGPATETEWARIHLLDSLIVAFLERPAPRLNVIDIGSGAGLPGLVWAVCHPQDSITSLDTAGKKITFQQVAARRLGLDNFFPLKGDVREYSKLPAGRGGFDLVLSRAFAPLERLLPVAACWFAARP